MPSMYRKYFLFIEAEPRILKVSEWLWCSTLRDQKNNIIKFLQIILTKFFFFLKKCFLWIQRSLNFTISSFWEIAFIFPLISFLLRCYFSFVIFTFLLSLELVCSWQFLYVRAVREKINIQRTEKRQCKEIVTYFIGLQCKTIESQIYCSPLAQFYNHNISIPVFTSKWSYHTWHLLFL